MTTPNAIGPLVDPKEALAALKSFQAKPTPRPRSERSAPVRNPAFRESEELKALQRKLNSRR